jgi:outer membrane protein TolC
MRREAADARRIEASVQRLPWVRAYGSYTRLSDVPAFQATIPANAFGSGFPPNDVNFPLSQTILDNYMLRLSVQQPIFTGFRLQNSYNLADETAQAASEEYQRDRLDLVYGIKSAYWSLFRAIEVKKVVDENVALVRAHLNDAQNLMNQGLVTTNDVLRVQVQLSNALIAQIDADNNVTLATLALNNVIGQPLETQVELASAPDTAAVGASLQANLASLIDTAAAQRNDLKAFQHRVEAASAGVSVAKSGWFPQIYLTGSYYYARPNQRIVPAQDEFKDTWDVSLTASWDIWNWGTTLHQTRQAQAQLRQAEDGLALLKDAAVLEVTQSYLSLRQAHERISVAREAVGQADENYRVTNEKFKQGLSLNTDLLDAELSLLQSKTAYTQTVVDYELAAARLERSVGRQ